MAKLALAVVVLVVVLVVGGVVYLGTADIAPSTQKVEKVIPDDRLPH
ncbi:MAG: hypothetical protein U1F33_17080 [Alphaproteobacteria bacterium]